MMNHLIHQEDSHQELPHDDHLEVVARRGSRSRVMHPKAFFTQKLWSHQRAKLELQWGQASQESLHKYELDGIPNWPSQVLFDLDSEASAKRMAILCAIASSLSYKNMEDDIKGVVNGMWNMWFVHFFNCKNETQAFMFTDKEQNPNAVVIVFRGTELKVDDWGTDIDCAMSPIKDMDREIQVHDGFRKALGIPTESCDKAEAVAPSPSADDIRTSGVPHDQAVAANHENEESAYDVICSYLENILSANPEAKVFVTGHSLGGALAALFTAVLMHKNHGIQSNLKGVFTFGQPRVGNAGFAQYMKDRLCAPNNARKYFRVVLKNDVVPRVPPDDMLLHFKHISPCVYYDSSQHCEIMEEEPHKNLLSDILMAHIAAIKELFRSLRHGTAYPLMKILTPAACDHSCLGYIEAVKKTAPSVFLKQAT